MRQVNALVHFPPGLLPLMASFLGPDSIFVAGGYEDSGALSSVLGYCVSTSTWRTDVPSMTTARNTWRTDVPSMTTARSQPAAVALGGRMMVFGGVGAGYNNYLSACEAFDPITNKWTVLPPMSTPRDAACAVAWQGISLQRDNGRAFVFGGHNGSTPLASAECFDPTLNQWFRIAHMSTARSHAAAVTVPGHGIIVMGGWIVGHVLSSAELYDPATDQWTLTSWNLPKQLCSFAAHFIDGVLHIIGGFTPGVGYVTDCWSMDLGAESMIWSQLPPLPRAMDGLSSAML